MGIEREVLGRLVGRRLRSVRKLRGMSQTALALEAGISQVSVSHIESGQRITITMLCDICRVLGIKLSAVIAEVEDHYYADIS